MTDSHRIDLYSELADALGCDGMDSHAGRLARARRLAALDAVTPATAAVAQAEPVATASVRQFERAAPEAMSEDRIERFRLEHCDRGILQKGAAMQFARALIAARDAQWLAQRAAARGGVK